MSIELAFKRLAERVKPIPTTSGSTINYTLSNNGNSLLWLANTGLNIDYDNTGYTTYTSSNLQEFTADTDLYITDLRTRTTTAETNISNISSSLSTHVASVVQHISVEYITVDTVVTFANTTTQVIVDYTSLQPTATFTMPANPTNNQIIRLCSGTHGITSLTLNANTGHTILSPITSLIEGEFATYIFRTNTWYRT